LVGSHIPSPDAILEKHFGRNMKAFAQPGDVIFVQISLAA
jgi:hypothetical protein